MNGLLAAAFWASTILHPEASILSGIEKRAALGHTSFAFSKVKFQKQQIGSQLSVSSAAEYSYGPLQPVFSLSVTDQGGKWAGLGYINTVDLDNKLFARFRFIPGVYAKNQEVDLGGWLMFKSEVEFGYNIDENWSVSLSYDHRSSGDIWPYNPGLETLAFRISRNKGGRKN